MAEDLFVRPDGKPMTFLMNSSQEKKKVKFDPNVSLYKVSPWFLILSVTISLITDKLSGSCLNSVDT